MPADPTPPPRDLRRRILRLDALPVRPRTARIVLARHSAATTPDSRPLENDPGWVLARLRAGPDAPELALLAAAPWWPAAGAAIEALWRHAVANRCAARRLAGESGIDDPNALARLALLADLGHWALAAAAPGALAELLGLPDPEQRRARERELVGTDLATLARDLADRWDLPAPLAEALWLAGLGDVPPGLPPAEQATVSLLRRARAWADRTPWARDPAPREPVSPDPRLRLLIAEVQLQAAEPFVAPDATPHEEQLARAHADLLHRHARLRRDHEAQSHLLGALARPDEPPESPGALPTSDPAATARQAWTGLIRLRDRLADRLDRLAEAHRRQVAADGPARAVERLDALAEFAAGAAHELNNPLAVILGRAQLLLAKAGDAESARSLRAIIGQAQRAHRILRDLIYVARPPEPRPRPCLPGEVARLALRDLADEAAARGVRIEAELAEAGGPAALDPDALRHAIEVLARNALEATPAGREVRVSVRADSGRLHVAVRDGGPGLDPRSARHLLDPFYCGRQAGRGLGLGLARLARALAQAGGDLRWQSAPGSGTTFQVRLPLGAAAEPAGPFAGPHLPGRRSAVPGAQAIS